MDGRDSGELARFQAAFYTIPFIPKTKLAAVFLASKRRFSEQRDSKNL